MRLRLHHPLGAAASGVGVRVPAVRQTSRGAQAGAAAAWAVARRSGSGLGLVGSRGSRERASGWRAPASRAAPACGSPMALMAAKKAAGPPLNPCREIRRPSTLYALLVILLVCGNVYFASKVRARARPRARALAWSGRGEGADGAGAGGAFRRRRSSARTTRPGATAGPSERQRKALVRGGWAVMWTR